MADMMTHSKGPVSLDKYSGWYKKDYLWCEDYKPRKEEESQKLQTADAQLRAKMFPVPWEKRVTQRREVMPEPSIKTPDLQQRKDLISAHFPAESYSPKYYGATKLAATQAEKSERLQTLPELKNKLLYRRRLPAAAQTSETTGTLLRRQKLEPNWITHQQFVQETSQATKHNAQRNRNKNLGSSVLMEEYFEINQRSVYKTDFGRQPGPFGGRCKPNKTLSHIFSEDDFLDRNHSVSEYKDNYSIFLQRQNGSSQMPSGLPQLWDGRSPVSGPTSGCGHGSRAAL